MDLKIPFFDLYAISGAFAIAALVTYLILWALMMFTNKDLTAEEQENLRSHRGKFYKLVFAGWILTMLVWAVFQLSLDKPYDTDLNEIMEQTKSAVVATPEEIKEDNTKALTEKEEAIDVEVKEEQAKDQESYKQFLKESQEGVK